MHVERWAHLTSPELGWLAARDPVALLPLAAIEQHGPHLPLSTDLVIGEGIVDAALAELADKDSAGELLLMPALVLGASLEHEDFPGTLSLSTEQVIAQILAAGVAAARAGIRRLVLFNSHGGNRPALDAAALQLRAHHGMLAVRTNYSRFAVPEGTIGAEELAHGIHGGRLETAMMLHLAPSAVRLHELADYRPLGAHRAQAGLGVRPSGDASFAWLAQDLHPAGVAGNAAAADAATGERLVAAFGRRLADIVLETAAFDLALLRQRPAG